MAKNLILAKAQNAVLAHDWATAARLYKELLRGDESNVDYLKELGSIYVKGGEDEKAIPYYEQIITFYPHYIEAMNSLGAIYRRLKRYEESITILQKALDEGRNTAAVHYNLGFTYKEMGNYEDAIDAFETVITENPDDVLAYNHLGSIYFAEKDYEKSIASFKRGLQVDPNHPILNYNLARCYEADKNYTESIRCYEATLKTKPGWTEAIRDFSELLIKCQNNKKAQTLVEKSIQLHPRDIDLLCILGRIFINSYDYDNATKTYKKANSIDGNNIKVLIGFSEALEKGNKPEEALDKALEAIDIDPYNKDVRKQYVHTLLSNQRYDQAYENVMSLNEETKEKDPQVLDLCAQYYICRGDESQAKAYHEKIQKVNHHYKDHMLNASDRYVQIGDFDKAEEYAKQFVERRSQLPDGYNRLGVIYQAKGDLKNAKINFEKGKKYCEPNVIADESLKKLNQEISENPERYEYETPSIEVDVENVQTEEQYIPSSFVGEVVGSEEDTAQTEGAENEFDYDQLGENVPMGEALLEKENDFWEDFDDDPNAETKNLADEENAMDEEQNIEASEEADDFDDDIFQTLGGSELGNEMVDDGEFDFSSLDGENPSSDDEDCEIPAEELSDDGSAVEGEAASEDVEPVQPINNAGYRSMEPVMQQAQTPYEQSLERQMQSSAFNSADRAMDMAVMTQKMVQQLADQQRNFEENFKETSEKMIHEEVEKAVEEKIQASIDNQMLSVMDDEDSFDDVDDFVTETDDVVQENDFAEVSDFVVEDTDSEDEIAETQDVEFCTVEELAGEEAEPIENPFAEPEDFFGEVTEFMGEEAVPVKPVEKVELEDDFDAVEDFAGIEDESPAEVADVAEEVPYEEDDFAVVEDFVENEPVAEEPVVDEEDFAGVEEFVAEEEVPEEDSITEEEIVADEEENRV